MEKTRCAWCTNDEIYKEYHDTHWGVPCHDERTLFEMLILEGMQAGLSWLTILKKRENFNKAFDNFDILKITNYDKAKIEELMNNAGIIRNRLKIEATIKNAKAIIEIQKEFGNFDTYIWGFVDNAPIIGNWKSLKDVPVTTEISDKISKNLKKRGCSFVGSTIIYSYMQAIGMVNDHTTDCFCFSKV